MRVVKTILNHEYRGVGSSALQFDFSRCDVCRKPDAAFRAMSERSILVSVTEFLPQLGSETVARTRSA